MASLFSYVVDHDLGFAPNPLDGFCTLVHCKFGGAGGPVNIVELAEEQDWVLGSGGQSEQRGQRQPHLPHACGREAAVRGLPR